jgi:ADP-ribosylglycohydrolase
MASAVADAMAGPHEGRTTAASEQFLNRGGWINQFDPYTIYHQHHWNVFPRHGSPGLYTDDSRLRLLLCQAMIENNETKIAARITKKELAGFIFNHYHSTRESFFLSLKTAGTAGKKHGLHSDESIKESFLNLWFLWEICKLASEVYIPETPKIISPGYERVDRNQQAGDWRIRAVTPKYITSSIKNSYNDNSYHRGEEMPIGLIMLLPVAFYFPGQPAKAFSYVLEIDFLDIKKANLYAALMVAIIADLLAGTVWREIKERISNENLIAYVNHSSDERLHQIQSNINLAFEISSNFRRTSDPYERNNYIEFIKTLHTHFACGEIMMCTVDEMLTVPLALLDYAPIDNLRQVIELSINYGRDNDTVASLTAGLAGAASGPQSLPGNWQNTVQKANNQFDMRSIAGFLSRLNFVS